MKVVAVASAKGGSGKSTIVVNLAARAALESSRVALLDLNADQANTTAWWLLRGEPKNPVLIDVENIARDTQVLRAEKLEWAIIDTPASDLDVIEGAVAVADCVLIPVRASMFDVASITPVVEMCRERHKPFGFVMAAVDMKMPRLTERAKAALVTEGHILHGQTSYRQDHISALTAGKVGFEVQKDLRPEIDLLWEEVKQLAGTSSHSVRVSKERAAANG
jgi:chromosome partitioning protein